MCLALAGYWPLTFNCLTFSVASMDVENEEEDDHTIQKSCRVRQQDTLGTNARVTMAAGLETPPRRAGKGNCRDSHL